MRKRRTLSRTSQVSNLNDYLRLYDSATLEGLLNSFESSEAWKVFMAYSAMVQRAYEVEALDMMGKEGSVKSAAFASGYAKCAEDMQQSFMAGLKNTVNRVSPVIENVRPEVDDLA